MLSQQDLSQLRATVQGLQTGTGDRRAVEVVGRVLDALYPVLLETRVTWEEWEAVTRFLGETDPVMMRAIGWCLGLSQVVQEANSRIGPGATPECIEGPFHRPSAPELAPGMPLHQVDDGADYLLLEGRVLSVAGEPVAAAELDVWTANGEENYSFFDPAQPEHNCRGRLRSGSDGRWTVFSPKPAAYHMDVAQMGAVLRVMGHQIWRPAHVHFIIKAQGYEQLTTQLYFEGDPHTHDDPAVGVKPELIIPLQRHEGPERGLDRPVHIGRFDFRLQPAA